MQENNYYNRDLSWLSFNHRVLMEAGDETVPLMERLNFLSIYSSNLDEFYRVRIPTLRSIKKLLSENDPIVYEELLQKIGTTVQEQMQELGKILTQQIIPGLRKEKTHLVYDDPIPDSLKERASDYFFRQVVGYLQPVMMSDEIPELLIENNKLQVLVILENNEQLERLVVVNIPTEWLPRFFPIDDTDTGIRYILFLDDIIKENIGKLYPAYKVKGVFSFKITRDASLDLHDEFVGDIAEKIGKELQKREAGLATRLLYQPGIPLRVLYGVMAILNLKDANAVPGGTYHNLKDLRSLPVFDKAKLSYPQWATKGKESHPDKGSIFDALLEKDIMVHTPFQSFYPVIRFFTDAMLDETVTEIYATIYRVASDSMILNALITAAKNGKKVTVFVELKARFDEANNLKWSAKMKDAGIRIIYSIPGLKVHAKVALVKRKEQGRARSYGLLSTGNFNEGTAQLYTDHMLLTANKDIVRELELLFLFFGFRKQPDVMTNGIFDQLWVAQFNLQEKLLLQIDKEIKHKKEGKDASVVIKLNSLEDKVLINKLYEASTAGVTIQLIVRSICCLIPGVEGVSENIIVTRIVDRNLEHGRIFVFQNDGDPIMYMGSADWMNRSMYHRIEVCYPVLDMEIKKLVMQMLEIQIADNVKAVTLNKEMQQIRKTNEHDPIRSQEKIYQLLNS